MARVINTANPGKERSHLRRTIAEMLRHLVHKRRADGDTKDMVAATASALRGIAETVEATTSAWEKRDYFLKADRFRLEWEWVSPAADRLEAIALEERWDELPEALAALASRFRDIRILKMTRPPTTWQGAYRLLQLERRPAAERDT